MNIEIKIRIASEGMSIDELLELIEWKLKSLKDQMPGNFNLEMAGYEILPN
tara:strand:+ start:45 stop:197 length:153 start_codon:yes stop_codon:yes gene_type:complete